MLDIIIADEACYASTKAGFDIVGLRVLKYLYFSVMKSRGIITLTLSKKKDTDLLIVKFRSKGESFILWRGHNVVTFTDILHDEYFITQFVINSKIKSN